MTVFETGLHGVWLLGNRTATFGWYFFDCPMRVNDNVTKVRQWSLPRLVHK
jgi:hypothetical protein